jgi:KaiC/GvpD/RAD55 family RecA-like ATPase
MPRIETTIFSSLLHNEEYLRRVVPFLKEEYFSSDIDRKVFNRISEFVNVYNAAPTQEALTIMFQNDQGLNEEEYKKLIDVVDDLSPPTSTNQLEWLIDESEKFCKEKAIYNAIVQSIAIIDGREKIFGQDAIPTLLQDALGVCFDTNVGHDYFGAADERFEFYHKKESRIPFDLDLFNKITKGGIPRKTLNMILAGTGVGKSLAMCHFASAYLAAGLNVLYITMEMAEERISERIDANLLNVSLDDLEDLPKAMFQERIQKIRKKTQGELIVKEYPTASAHVAHFRALLNELKLKKDFVPDVIFIDYLNICASSRYKASAQVNMYTYVKAIAEEIRGLAVESNVPIWSATQTNRTGFSNSDVGLEETSESFGLPATADFMIALIQTEELEQLGQYMVKQLKNRYNDKVANRRFVIGVEKSKMRLYDLDESAQRDIVKDAETPGKVTVPLAVAKKFTHKDFSGIKV